MTNLAAGDTSVGSTPVHWGCKHPQTRIHANGALADFDERVAQSDDVCDSGYFVHILLEPQDAVGPFEVEAALETGAVDRYHRPALHRGSRARNAYVPCPRRSPSFPEDGRGTGWCGIPMRSSRRHRVDPRAGPIAADVPRSPTMRIPGRASPVSRRPSASRTSAPVQRAWQRTGRSHRTRSRETGRRGDRCALDHRRRARDWSRGADRSPRRRRCARLHRTR